MFDEITRWIRGAAGLAKATAGLHPAPLEVVLVRRRKCQRCPNLTKDTADWPFRNQFGPWGCVVCRCFIEPKTRLKTERCPKGIW